MKKAIASVLILLSSPALAERQPGEKLPFEIEIPDFVFSFLGFGIAVLILWTAFRAIRENGGFQDPDPRDLQERPATNMVKIFCNMWLWGMLCLLVVSFTSCGTEMMKEMSRLP